MEYKNIFNNMFINTYIIREFLLSTFNVTLIISAAGLIMNLREEVTYFTDYDFTTNAVEGRCVIWPAFFTHTHRGIVSKTETKYIATGWFQYS